MPLSITQYSDNGTYSDVCRQLAYKLPCIECLKTPNILIIQYGGVYFVVKSRVEIEGDPCNAGHTPVSPYDLEFLEYTLAEVRNKCNPLTQFKVPKDFIGNNILIYL